MNAINAHPIDATERTPSKGSRPQDTVRSCRAHKMGAVAFPERMMDTPTVVGIG